MQPMPTMPTPQQMGWDTYNGLCIYSDMKGLEIQQMLQSTHASDSTGSSIPHQIPEEQQERTGGQTGLALHNRPTRAFGGYKHDDYIDEDGPSRTSSELEHAHDIDNDSEDIGVCLAVE